MSAGERIRDLRIKKGWSQKKLHLKSGVAEITIRKYENSTERQPRLEQLQKIADALGTTTAYLTGETSYSGRINFDSMTKEQMDMAEQKLKEVIQKSHLFEPAYSKLHNYAEIAQRYGLENMVDIFDDYDAFLDKYSLTHQQFLRLLDEFIKASEDKPE